MPGFDIWDQLIEKFAETGANAQVNWQEISLGNADPDDGWFAISYGAETPINCFIFSKGAQLMLVGTGLAVKMDALGLTKQLMKTDDKLTDQLGYVWLVQTVTPHVAGNQLLFYEVDLVRKESF